MNGVGQLTDSSGRAFSKRDSGPKIVAGKWHMIGIVVDCLDGGSMSIYVDGVKCTLGAASASVEVSTSSSIAFDGNLSIGNQICLCGSKGKAYSSRGTNLR